MDEKVVLAIAQNKAAEAGSVTQEKVSEAVGDYITDNPSALNQAAVEAIVEDRIDSIVLVQDQQPTEEDNKIWIPDDDVNETQVPTQEEFDVLKSAIEDLEAGSLSALGATAGQVPVADGNGSWAWGAQAGGMQTIQVSGTTPAITAVANTQYICGEVATLDITLPASGCIDVVFESGSTPTVLTVTPPPGVTVKWANGFDPTALEANTTYEINIKDGLGVGAAWT